MRAAHRLPDPETRPGRTCPLSYRYSPRVFDRPPQLVADLKAWGHDVEVLGEWDETMGHAGALVRHANGLFEGGADPRSDGAVAAF